MKKLKFYFCFLIVIMMVACANESIINNNSENKCEVTFSFNSSRGWNAAVYKISAREINKNKTVTLPDSYSSTITYSFDVGSYEFNAKIFDNNDLLIYRGKTTATLTTGTNSVTVYAFKNTGSCSLDISGYASNVSSFDAVKVVAKKASFEDEVIEVADFSQKVIFADLAVGLWNFTISYKKSNNWTVLDTVTREIVADMFVKYNATGTTTTTTTTSTTTTTVAPFTGYRVHLFGDNWSTHSIYYYNSDTVSVGQWPGKTMIGESDGFYYDLTENWVSGGTTKIIFYGGDNNNRYPANLQDGIDLPTGVTEAWFDFSTKQWETSNPFSTDPVVSITPYSTATFSSQTLAVTFTAKNCVISKYTLDGSDPATSSTAISFANKVSVNVGSGLSIGQTVTVKVYGTDGNQTVNQTATFTKVEKSLTPTRLGAYYTPTATSFSIWSPDSSNVKVEVKKNGESSFTSYTCEKGFVIDSDYADSSNIYGVTVQGDCHLAEYQFKIGGVAVRDPYGVMVKYENQDAKTNAINESYLENNCTMSSYAGSSINIVLDMEKTDLDDGWATRPTLDDRCDSIVYEVHVGDFTSSSTWGGSPSYAGKFPGMVQSGTTYSGSTTVKTGLDHLKELGVTHVQIMPMYDFATKYNANVGEYYNWGYDPVNYNVPEDRYSTCPSNYVARIQEVKNMINEFHKNGIRVIMDVVYNHTFDKEMFKNITNRYYTQTDLSGCGNSVDTGNTMVSRFIRDSLEFWAEEYNIDGFRFDLLGIYHTTAVKEWGEYMNTKFSDRNLLMYGEPWNGYASDNESIKVRMGSVSSMASGHIGVFNGKYRETIKGSNDNGNKGYMCNTNYDGNSTVWNVAAGLKGSGTGLDKSNCSDTGGTWTRFFTATPEQSINYITAHDNLCLFDKILASQIPDVAYQQAIVKFGHGILLVSQGIPFIHCGDEFLRTKKVGSWAAQAHNSYMFGQEMNQIDWSLKATNYSLFKYHSDLISLRKAHDGLRYRNGVGTTNVSGQVITYTVTDTNGAKLNIVINPGDTINKSGLGTQIFNKTGKVNISSTECEGTGVIIFQQ